MVPQGYEWTVERFGRYTHTLSPGLHFLVPVMYGVGRKINMAASGACERFAEHDGTPMACAFPRKSVCATRNSGP